jgi:hypothetical protein
MRVLQTNDSLRHVLRTLRSDKATQGVELLLDAIAHPGVFYILGAGASAGLVPFGRHLSKTVLNSYLKIGSYPAGEAQPSILRARLFSDGSSVGLDQRLLLDLATDPCLTALLQKSLTPHDYDHVPAQYELFRHVGRPSTIFNFNLDGLATNHLAGHHRVIEPHGQIDSLWTTHDLFNEWLELGVDMRFLSEKHLWGPEPSSLTSTRHFTVAWPRLESAFAVVIIGYSFGFVDERMDDAESFEWVVEGLRRTAARVFVVDPSPERVAGAIAGRIHPRRIVNVKARWNELAESLLSLKSRLPQLDPLEVETWRRGIQDKTSFRLLEERLRAAVDF